MIKKIKWKNVIKFILLTICSYLILNDIYTLLIKPFIVGYSSTYTLLGIITLFAAIFIGGTIYDEFKRQ